MGHLSRCGQPRTESCRPDGDRLARGVRRGHGHDHQRPVVTGRLGDVTWTDLWNLAPRPIIAIPVGSCEQHGPHLPLDTDSRIALALAEG
ncbi:MAG: creatininase family protein, partial [Ilumatobacteraceae bacterium]